MEQVTQTYFTFVSWSVNSVICDASTQLGPVHCMIVCHSAVPLFLYMNVSIFYLVSRVDVLFNSMLLCISWGVEGRV